MSQSLKLVICVCLFAVFGAAQTPPLAIPFASKVKLTASDGAANDDFGFSVAISTNGGVVVAGAPEHDTFQGAAYVFLKPTSGPWINATQNWELSVGQADGEFGDCVAISGTGATIAVGAPGAGAVFVFTAVGGNPASGYTQAAELSASGAGSYFGCGLAISSNGETVAAGGVNTTITDAKQDQGAVYVFTEPGTGWSGTVAPPAVLTASDAVLNQNLGNAVSISGNTIAAGAWDYGLGSGGPGAVYVFTKTGANWTTGTQTAKLTASDGASLDGLGESVSISGSTIVAGAPGHKVGSTPDEGALYVFVENTGTGWVNSFQTAELTASNGVQNGSLGAAVTVSGTIVVGGAYCQTVGKNSCEGEVFAYIKPSTGWVNGTENFDLTASGGTAGEELGWSTGVAGEVGVSGAISYVDPTNPPAVTGAVYVFAP